MGKYLGLMKIGIKSSLQYRTHFIVGALTSPISLLIYWFLWKSIFNYSGQEVLNGFTFPMMLNYYVMNIIVGIITWTMIEEWMSEDVRNGEIVTPLLKPIGFQSWYFVSEKADIILRLLFQIIPVFIISLIFFKLKIYSLSAVIFFLISVFLAMMIAYYFAYIVALSSFWLKKIGGIRRMKKALLAFLGGGLIPLSFFPQGFQNVSKYLPFEYTRGIPINIYIEKITGIDIYITLGIQIIWVAILFVISYFLYKIAITKFTGEGT